MGQTPAPADNSHASSSMGWLAGSVGVVLLLVFGFVIRSHVRSTRQRLRLRQALYQEYQDLDTAELYKPESKLDDNEDADALCINDEATPLIASSTSRTSEWASSGYRGHHDQLSSSGVTDAEALTPNLPTSQPQCGELYLALINVCQQFPLKEASQQARGLIEECCHASRCQSLLHFVLQQHPEIKHFHLVAALCQLIDPRKDMLNEDGYSPYTVVMHDSANPDANKLVPALYAYGVPLSQFDATLRTPLMNAVVYDNWTVWRMLIAHASQRDFGLRDPFGNALVHHTLHLGAIKMLEDLLRLDPLCCFRRTGSTEDVERGERHRGDTCLHIMVREGQLKMLECIPKKHVETAILHVCAFDNEGITPLELAAFIGDKEAATYLKQCCQSLMERHKGAVDMATLSERLHHALRMREARVRKQYDL